MLCPELGEMTAELVGVPPPTTATGELSIAALLTLKLDTAGPCVVMWNRWWTPPPCCGCAFPYIGATRASPKIATHVFMVFER